MFCPILSSQQLEERAYETLAAYDKELLHKTKQIDVYDVIEKLLDVPYDWKYLTPNQSVLGATVFNSGYVWVWPEPVYRNGMMPIKLPVKKGTILIEATLTESDSKGRENFTVMHEVFHQILHKDYFINAHTDYVHFSKTIEYNNEGHKKLITELDFIEYQANHSAACFLMPRELVIESFEKKFSKKLYSVLKETYINDLIREMADEFNTSETAMKYRLNNLKVLEKVGDGKYYRPVSL